jgi:hypothetical protein
METAMTMLSISFVVPAPAEHKRSIRQRILDAIEARSQRKADRDIAKVLRDKTGFDHDEFRIELERRLLGQ